MSSCFVVKIVLFLGVKLVARVQSYTDVKLYRFVRTLHFDMVVQSKTSFWFFFSHLWVLSVHLISIEVAKRMVKKLFLTRETLFGTCTFDVESVNFDVIASDQLQTWEAFVCAKCLMCIIFIPYQLQCAI